MKATDANPNQPFWIRIDNIIKNVTNQIPIGVMPITRHDPKTTELEVDQSHYATLIEKKRTLNTVMKNA